MARAPSPARKARALPRDGRTKKAPPLDSSGGVLATSYSRTAYRRTTIGAAAFHCRVRNGNGWGHCAIVTRAEKRLRCPALVRDSKFVTSVLPIDDSRFTISFKERQFAGIYIQEFGKCYPPSLKLRRDRQL